MQSDVYQRKSELKNFVELLPEQLNITTINNDCLYHIFEYFEWTDLLNVAETCKTLHAVSSHFFKTKYSGITIVGTPHMNNISKDCSISSIWECSDRVLIVEETDR